MSLVSWLRAVAPSLARTMSQRSRCSSVPAPSFLAFRTRSWSVQEWPHSPRWTCTSTRATPRARTSCTKTMRPHWTTCVEASRVSCTTTPSTPTPSRCRSTHPRAPSTVKCFSATFESSSLRPFRCLRRLWMVAPSLPLASCKRAPSRTMERPSRPSSTPACCQPAMLTRSPSLLLRHKTTPFSRVQRVTRREPCWPNGRWTTCARRPTPPPPALVC
mmetsp:Transcript_57631/g.66201  ORF Transcript_57631/g.66201 Transcript_57631/m.66201 type:complete len:217 (+) Transcript_57631:2018-2668(+)